MIRLFLLALSFAAMLIVAAGPARARNLDDGVSDPENGSKPAYLVAYDSPQSIRHTIAMASMKDCLRAAEYSRARCVSRLPPFPDLGTGHFRPLKKPSAVPVRVRDHDGGVSLPGDGSKPAFLVAYDSPQSIRHIIAMASMRDCLRAAEFTRARCISRLPPFPNLGTGHFRPLKKSALPR